MATSIVAQMLWLSFSALPPCTTNVLCPTADNVTFLTAIYPIVFVAISLPTGYFIDARGFRSPVILGATLLAVSGMLRPFAPSFPVLLALQGVGAVGQPFLLNSISKIARSWFPSSEVTTATGLGTLSIYIGLALGFGLTPVFASLQGTRGMLFTYGILAIVAAALFIGFGREPKQGVAPEKGPSFREIFGMLKIRNIALLSALFFLGIGVFNAFATYVQPMLLARGIANALGGILGGVMIIGGIAGALAMSVLADRFHTLRIPFLGCLGAATVLWMALGVMEGVVPETIVLFILGFFFMSALPLGLELSARSVSPSAEGAANALVWEFSQIGGSVLIFVFEGVGTTYGWTLTFFLAAAITASMLLFSFGLRSR